MLARIVRIVGEVVDPLVVVAAPQQEVPPLPDDVQLVTDEQEGLGPLAGIAAGLRALEARADAAYVSSCDVPLLQPAFIRAVIDQLGTHDLAIPRDGKYHHPLAAVFRTRLLSLIDRLIAEEQLRPFFVVEQSDSRVIDVSELRQVDPQLDSLRNMNTPDDYDALQRRAADFKPSDQR